MSDDMRWIDVTTLGICGRGWEETDHSYDRLPARAQSQVTPIVWQLSQQSVGMYVDFTSDTAAIHARCSLRVEQTPEHRYLKYLDLYARDEQHGWRWVGVSRYGHFPSGETPLIEDLPRQSRQWRLYLPLGYHVDTLSIGISPDAQITATPTDTRKPIVIYGTSIVHGMWHVSRPGMAWPSIVGRQLDWPVINLGFSGSACMEPDLGQVLSELDPAVWVIDPLANMSLETVIANARAFLLPLCAKHPRTPLVMMDDRTHEQAWILPDYAAQRDAKQAEFRAIAQQLSAEGIRVSYVQGSELIGTDGEGTTDGSHPSDLGAYRYAQVMTPVLSRVLYSKA